jgi:hypothetical protein
MLTGGVARDGHLNVNGRLLDCASLAVQARIAVLDALGVLTHCDVVGLAADGGNRNVTRSTSAGSDA